ncbi:MAG: ATP-binding protein [Candidatus Saccharimonadales bacterium]
MDVLILNNILIFIVISTGMTIGLWGYLGNKHNIVNQLFFLFVNLILLNILFSYLFKVSSDVDQATLWARLIFVSASLLIPSFYLFAVYFPSSLERNRLFDVMFIMIGVVLTCLSLFTNYFVKGVVLELWGMQVMAGPLVFVFYIALIFAVVASFCIIVLKYLRSSRKEKRQIIYPIYGIALFVACNVIFGILLPAILNNSKFLSLADYSALFFIGFTAYAIVKVHLFDVKFAIIRSVTYFLVLATLAVIYFVIAFILSLMFGREETSTWQIISNLVTSLLLAFLIRPLKLFFDKVTNRIFYKDRYHTDDFYSRLNDALTLNTDLRGILKRASHVIAGTLKCEQVFFFINTTEGHYVSEGTPHHKQLPKKDVEKVNEFCGGDYHAIAASLLDRDIDLKKILESHGIEIVLPLTQADKVVGYLCLGTNLSSGYTTRDIRALNMIADEMVIAVQNALAVQKILELNSTLKQRINDATKELRSKNSQLKRLDKAKDEFVSVAAHELRTPMTVFRGFISLLQRKSLGPITGKQQEVLEKMNVNTKNLIDLVNNMLDLSKLEANRLTMEFSDDSMNNLVNKSLEKIALLYESKGVTLKYESGVDAQIYTDAEKFQRVLVNLLSNSYKFTPAGGSVTVSSKINEDGQYVTVCVSDTGIGMPADAMGKLFKKFSQVDNYLQKTSGGTGLGLSICKQMVEKMNGKIWVESELSAGSKFYFTMPLSAVSKQS